MSTDRGVSDYIFRYSAAGSLKTEYNVHCLILKYSRTWL
jgi:hypothetical protein